VAVLAARRADDAALDKLDELVETIGSSLDDFAGYRQADVRLHMGLAESTQSPSLVTAMTEIQGAMTGLIDLIPHPPEILAASNQQHIRVLEAIRRHDGTAAAAAMIDHLHGTEHILAGLLPDC
ncbi:MAG: FadR family transcriptional regulator, partial [Solirubrobacterales bacterium]|nr:FadR family transcriptional regulator [Solirubrobacterales bacterium]